MPSILNSDDGVVSGTSGLKTTGGNDGITAFQQNGTERMRIDSSGNVQIGTTTSNGRLTVSGSSSGAYIAQTLENTNSGGYAQQIFRIGSAGGSGTANINYAPGLLFALGPTANDTTTPILFLNNNGTERARIPAAGGFQCVNSISVGNATPTTSGAGITFPATQSASSNANTLDDYEEGTWTGTLKGSTTDPTTPVTATGLYTKIGRLVLVQIQFSDVTTTGAAGGVVVTGLPFTVNGAAIGSVMSYNFNFNGLTSACSYASGTTIEPFVSGNNAAWGSMLHNAGTGRFLWMNVTYMV